MLGPADVLIVLWYDRRWVLDFASLDFTNKNTILREPYDAAPRNTRVRFRLKTSESNFFFDVAKWSNVTLTVNVHRVTIAIVTKQTTFPNFFASSPP